MSFAFGVYVIYSFANMEKRQILKESGLSAVHFWTADDSSHYHSGPKVFFMVQVCCNQFNCREAILSEKGFPRIELELHPKGFSFELLSI